MLRNTVLSFFIFLVFTVTANANSNGITVSNSSNKVVTLSCRSCVNCSAVTIRSMGKIKIDCVPSDDGYYLHYSYTRSDGITIQGDYNQIFNAGSNLDITISDVSGLVIAVEQ